MAAIAPVIDAEDKDIAFAMSFTFLFDMAMIALYTIMGFLALAALNSLGCIPAGLSAAIRSASKLLMVASLGALGMNTSLADFKRAGLAPMFYGVTIDTLVTITALAVIRGMGLV